jgi:hypothetical protein
MPLSAGAKFGRYQIIAPLGAGGMGEVYRARDPRLNRDVAIKLLPVAFARDPERVARFEHEARAASALNHPNIVSVFDIGHEGDMWWIVSELVEGESLCVLIKRGPVAPRRAVEIAKQIANGLAAAHATGIVHRDLKPANIMLRRDGHVKIVDFGLARRVPRTAEGSTLTLDLVTERGVMLGTIGYMSPEQVRGEPADARSDLFSFGAVLYEMLGGRRAFQGKTSADTISATLREDPPELTFTGRDIPPLLDRIVCHCLEKDVVLRFQSARDVEFALESLSAVSSVIAPRAAERKRLKWGVPALMVGIIVLLAAIWWMGRKGVAASPPDYQQLTFTRGIVAAARFAPDQHTVVYTAFSPQTKGDVFSIVPGSLAPITVGLKDTIVEAISARAKCSWCKGGSPYLITPRQECWRADLWPALRRGQSSPTYRTLIGARTTGSQSRTTWGGVVGWSTLSAMCCMRRRGISAMFMFLPMEVWSPLPITLSLATTPAGCRSSIRQAASAASRRHVARSSGLHGRPTAKKSGSAVPNPICRRL